MKFQLGQRVTVNDKEFGTIVEPLNTAFQNCDTYSWVKRDSVDMASLYPNSSINACEGSPPELCGYQLNVDHAEPGADRTATFKNGKAYGPKGNLIGDAVPAKMSFDEFCDATDKKELPNPEGSLIDDLENDGVSCEFVVGDAAPVALEDHIGEEASKLNAEVLQPLIDHVEDVVQKNTDNITPIPAFELNGYRFDVDLATCEESGDCGMFVAGINVTDSGPTEIGKWCNRIEVYGAKYDGALALRDMVYFAMRGNPKSKSVYYEGEDNSPIPQGEVGTAQFYQQKYNVEKDNHAETMSKLDAEVRSNDAKDNQLAAARMIEENMATEISELHAKVEGLIRLVHLQRDKAEVEEDLRVAVRRVNEYNTRILELNVHLDDIE